jgi:hypothetical protein
MEAVKGYFVILLCLGIAVILWGTFCLCVAGLYLKVMGW